VTYSVGVRSFFWGDEKPEEPRDSLDPETPTELGFLKVRSRHEMENHTTPLDGHGELRENPENRCDAQENAATKFTQSRYSYEKGRVASKRELIALPKKVEPVSVKESRP
jgi:hypothetical protein